MNFMNEYELVDACDKNLKDVVFMVDLFFKNKADGKKLDIQEDEQMVSEMIRLLTEILDFSAISCLCVCKYSL
jgi:hypothetical protein